MIISMNATVCGDITMVSDQRFMIIWSDPGDATWMVSGPGEGCEVQT